MSNYVMESGGTKPYKAEVDSAGRQITKSFTQSFEQKAVENGDAYNLNTGDLTIAGTSGVSYIKNNENKTIILTIFIYLLGNSTDGVSTEDGVIEIIENPTGGTLLSSTVGVPKNRNAGLQTKKIDVDWRIGADAKTVVGGTVLITSRLATPKGRVVVAVPTSIPQSSALAIKYYPQASNSSQVCQFAMAIYLDKFAD